MKLLPTVGTSAPSTEFCVARVDGPGDLHLFVDGNGKITRDQGSLEQPMPNALSLPAQAVEDAEGRGGRHCPGATESCKSACYVGGLAKHAETTYMAYRHNARAFDVMFVDPSVADEWVMTFSAWIKAHCTSFRWHVSGDVRDERHARWIRDVCLESPQVSHWIYTRSFETVPILAQAATFRGGPLALNLSCDADNYIAAFCVREEVGELRGRNFVGPRLCYLTLSGVVPESLPDDSVIFPNYELRGGTPRGRGWFADLPARNKAMVCPVDFHGKAPNRRCGPCDRCLT